MLQEALELLACPRCGGVLTAALRCEACGAEYGAPGGIPDLRLSADARTEKVREFYERAPFPGYPPRDSYGWLRARAGRSELARLLDQAIPGDARIEVVGHRAGRVGQCGRLHGGANPIPAGESRIRTYGTLRYSSFQDCRNRPLCHLS